MGYMSDVFCLDMQVCQVQQVSATQLQLGLGAVIKQLVSQTAVLLVF